MWFCVLHVMLCTFACVSALKVSVQLYSPLRTTVDIAEVFLWLMAVGTILCASYWSAWTAREGAIEREKLLKVTWFLFMSIAMLPIPDCENYQFIQISLCYSSIALL